MRFGWSLVNSWRDQGVRRICFTRGVGYWQPRTGYDFEWSLLAPNLQFMVRPLFKLLVDVAWSSRQKFNLTVSAETLVYKQETGFGKISKWEFEIWWGIVRILGPLVGSPYKQFWNHIGPIILGPIPQISAIPHQISNPHLEICQSLLLV